MVDFLLFVAVSTLIVVLLHWYSYRHLKFTITQRERWGLNICCGTVDGGGVNADIVNHGDVANFVRLESIYQLPFLDGQFDSVLCSHTAEHVDDPARFDAELRRVGRRVVYIVPPLWDLAASLNVREHRWLFLTFRKVHHSLPRMVRLPFASGLQARYGQKIIA